MSLHAAVHLAGVVAEDAQLEQLGRRSLSAMRLAVAALGADQHQQAGADRADAFARRPRPARCATRCTARSQRVLHVVEVRLDIARQQLDRWRAGPAPRSSAPARRRPRSAAARPSVQLGRHVHVQVDEAALAGAPRRRCGRSGWCWCRKPLERLVDLAPCTSGSSASSIRPSAERHISEAPSRRMFSATPMATTGSSHSQPVSCDQRPARDDAGRGPDVGDQVARIALQRDRALRAAPGAASPRRARR